jgi:hypothetical protein
MTYQWEKGFWTRPVRIFRDGNEVGRLFYDSGFTSHATGEIDGGVFRFQTKGLWKPTVIITDENERTYEVELGTWRSRGRTAPGLEWSTNVWNSRWRWTNDAGDLVLSSATGNLRGTQGTIPIADDGTPANPGMLMLTGMYVHAYFMAATTLLIVILVVLLT